MGAQTSLKHKGRNVAITTAGGGCGTLDDLTYSRDGSQLQSVTAQANGSDYYGRTGFALSATGGTAYFEFDAAGQLAYDSSREIMDMTYNRQGLPVQVSFEDGSNVIYTYSYAGELRSMKVYYKSKLTAKREYCGDFIFESDTLSMVNFPGGYFDGQQQPHYRHTDWQGNVTMVTNSAGKVEQHTGYYPYGEPWREPTGQPYLYGGKERLREGALNEYDFGARRYNSALALWTTPDPLAAKFGNTNPYSYCCANPIKFIDPDGRDAMISIRGSIITISANVIHRFDKEGYDYVEKYSKMLWSSPLDSIVDSPETQEKIEELNNRFGVNISNPNYMLMAKGEPVKYTIWLLNYGGTFWRHGSEKLPYISDD